MQSMAIRGFIVHDRESGAYALTDSGRATLAVILKNAGACAEVQCTYPNSRNPCHLAAQIQKLSAGSQAQVAAA